MRQYVSDDFLMHYGKGHLDGGHSGRYPWGSGKKNKSQLDKRAHKQSVSQKSRNKLSLDLTDKQKKKVKAMLGASLGAIGTAAVVKVVGSIIVSKGSKKVDEILDLEYGLPPEKIQD